MLNIEEIKQLIKLIDDSSIDEFLYETEGAKLKLKKQKEESTQAIGQTIQQPVPSIEVSRDVPQKTEGHTDAASETAETDMPAAYDHEILSPMVGTFYSSPKPESGPFVTKGTEVEESTVVCIIEAMKLFNEIEAEVSGEVVEILVENGELVEFGQPLFRVKSK